MRFRLQVATSSKFVEDLGLDSLDAVEVVMAIEEEFSIEIPDEEADNITPVQQAIDYIAKSPEGTYGSFQPWSSVLSHPTDTLQPICFHDINSQLNF